MDGWRTLDDRVEAGEPAAPHPPAERPDEDHAAEKIAAADPPAETVAAVAAPPEAGPAPTPPISGKEDGPADDFMSMPEDAEAVVASAGAFSGKPVERVKRRRSLPNVDAASVWTGAALAGAGIITGAAIVMLAPAGGAGHFRRAPPASGVVGALRPSPAMAEKGRSEAMVAQRSAGCGASHGRRQGREEIHLLTGNGHWVSLAGPGTPCWTLRTGEGADRIP
jgi:hypothetical protein